MARSWGGHKGEGHSMRKSRHDLLCLLALVVGGTLGCLVSCTPIKGYAGLERPKGQIALVTVSSESINTATADGAEFGSAGISLLPGSHSFQLAVSHGDRPYNCRPYTVLDTYGFDACQREREEDIRKEKRRPRECLLSAYTKHRKACLRDYHDSACEITLSLVPGKEYELDVPPGITGPPMVVAYTVTGSFLNKDRDRLPASGTCRFMGTRTEQEDSEGW
jgi:hypothetical protein